jgi:chromate reductase, NAD(P)H dehydrogenase (quinone)
MGGPQVVIGGIGDKVRDGALIDDASLSFALSALRRMIMMARPSSRRLTA